MVGLYSYVPSSRVAGGHRELGNKDGREREREVGVYREEEGKENEEVWYNLLPCLSIDIEKGGQKEDLHGTVNC